MSRSAEWQAVLHRGVGARVVKVWGRLDAAAVAKLVGYLRGPVRLSRDDIVLDLAEVASLDADAAPDVASFLEDARAHRVRVRVRRPHRRVAGSLDLSPAVGGTDCAWVSFD